MTAALPETIGRYEIIDLLGEGAMGVVFKARDPVIGRLVAIKTIRTDTGMTREQFAEFTQRFIAEARIAGTLAHPNIVTIYDVGQWNNTPFIAMECLEGRSLLQEMDAGKRFSTLDVVMLVSQMARGLDYAHGRKVVHRDIKPGNIMIQPDKRVKLMDFGIAKIPGTNATKSGVFLGSPSYTSPEQILGREVDRRADIFSLGVVIFEVCTGMLPFPGDNITTILYRIVHTPPSFPERIDELGYLEGPWRDVFTRVLDKVPARRFQRAEDFAEALKDCIAGQDPTHRLASRTDDLTLKGELFLQQTVDTASPEAIGASGSAGAPATTPAAARSERPAAGTRGRRAVDGGMQPSSSGSRAAGHGSRSATAGSGPGGVMGERPIALSREKPPDVFREDSEIPDSAGSVDLRFRPQAPGWEPEMPKPAARRARRRRRISVPRILVALTLVLSLSFAGTSAALYLGYGTTAIRDLTASLPKGGEQSLRARLERWFGDPAAVPAYHRMKITSEPSGAAIFFNLENTGDKTPADLTLAFFPGGANLIQLRRDGFVPAGRAFRPGAPPEPEIKLALTPDLPELEIQSSPAGSKIFLDGESVDGVTPMTVRLDLKTMKEIRVEKEGYRPARFTAEQVRAAGGTLLAALERIPEPGVLVIRSPFPVDVNIGSRKLSVREGGQGVYRVAADAGSSTFTIRNRTYFFYQKRKLTIPEGGEAVHTIPQTGWVDIKAIPSNCKISIDGAYVDFAPIIGLPIAAGKHTARFVWQASGARKSQSFTVTPGETTDVLVTESP